MTEGFEEYNGTAYWLGGDTSYKTSLGKRLALRVELWDADNTFFTSEFDFISIGESSNNFKINIGNFMKGNDYRNLLISTE